VLCLLPNLAPPPNFYRLRLVRLKPVHLPVDISQAEVSCFSLQPPVVIFSILPPVWIHQPLFRRPLALLITFSWVVPFHTWVLHSASISSGMPCVFFPPKGLPFFFLCFMGDPPCWTPRAVFLKIAADIRHASLNALVRNTAFFTFVVPDDLVW